MRPVERTATAFNLKGCSKFVFPNAGALGYYRFDYDTSALQAWEAAGTGADPGRAHRPDRR